MKHRTSAEVGIITLLAGLFVPVSAHAALGFGSLIELADTLAGGVVTSLAYLMFTVAVVAFFFGIVKFIWAARNGDAGKGVENGKQFMLWGLIALFVMFSVWGIIQFAQGVFGIRGENSIVIPRVQLLGGSSPTTRTGATSATCVSGSSCTTKNAVGATVSGYCNNVNQCVPSRDSDSRTGGSTCTSPEVTSGTGTCVMPGSPCIKSVCANGSCNNVSGKYSASGSCIENSGGTVGYGGSCRISPECSGNLTCDTDSVCRYPKGANCTEDPQCAEGGICDPATKKCR